MSEPIAYLKGEFVPASQCVLPVWDLGIVLAASVTAANTSTRACPLIWPPGCSISSLSPARISMATADNRPDVRIRATLSTGRGQPLRTEIDRFLNSGVHPQSPCR